LNNQEELEREMRELPAVSERTRGWRERKTERRKSRWSLEIAIDAERFFFFFFDNLLV